MKKLIALSLAILIPSISFADEIGGNSSDNTNSTKNENDTDTRKSKEQGSGPNPYVECV